MTLTEILDEIAQDSKLDNTKLDHASLVVPNLHAKWMRTLMHERRLARVLETELGVMTRDKTLYYMGKCPDDVYKARPLHHKVLKQDLPLWLNADDELNSLQTRAYEQQLKINAVESFLKELGQRSFHIRNAIEFIKFQNGAI